LISRTLPPLEAPCPGGLEALGTFIQVQIIINDDIRKHLETSTRHLISVSPEGTLRNGCRTPFCDFPDVASSGGPVPRWVYDLVYPV
jgi:hypothetical protein